MIKICTNREGIFIMSYLYSDEELSEESSIESTDDLVNKSNTEYFSDVENNLLNSVMNLSSSARFEITKKSSYIKLDLTESFNIIKDNLEKSSAVNQKILNMSIYISTLDTSSDFINSFHPLVYVESIQEKVLFNEINIKLSKIQALIYDKKKKIKLYMGDPKEGILIEKLISNTSDRFEKLLLNKNIEKLNLSITNLMYIEIFYYTTLLVREKINILNNEYKKDIFNYDDPLGVLNKYRKFDKSDIIYEDLLAELNSAKCDSTINKSNIDSIPKNLLYSKKQIIDILINQIKIVNENKEYPHFINSNEETKFFSFEINIVNKKGINIKLLLTVDSELHPFYPPRLKIISPSVKLNLEATISNLEILRLENWNPTINIESLVLGLANNLENIDEYISEETTDIERKIIQFAIIIGESVEAIKFSFDFKRYKINEQQNNEDKYWKSGVGYGYSGRNTWDIKEYIKSSENQQIIKSFKLEMISNELENYSDDYLKKLFSKEGLIVLKYLKSTINDTTLLEINRNVQLYNSVIKIIPKVFKYIVNNDEYKISICEGIKNIRDDLAILLETTDDEKRLNLYVSFISLYDTIKDEHQKLIFNISKKKEQNSTFQLFNNFPENHISNLKEEYMKMVSKQQLDIFKDYKFSNTHRFFASDNTNGMSNKSIIRISSELSSLKKNLPNNWDTSVILRTSKNNLSLITFLITGPDDTPYHNGIFEFHGHFPNEYPSKEPKILLDTTGNGAVRFNPNLYNCGKVCLSLLGTWNGSAAEKWNPSTSTLLQVLVSIQSLILVKNPYFNEPGWERQMHSMEGKKKSQEYNDNIRLQTLRWAIVDKIKNPPKGFEEFTKEHFRMKKKEILDVVKVWLEETKFIEEMKSLRKELIGLLNDGTDSIQSSSEKSDSDFKLDSKLVPLKNSKYDSKLSLTDSNTTESMDVISVELDGESIKLPNDSKFQMKEDQIEGNYDSLTDNVGNNKWASLFNSDSKTSNQTIDVSVISYPDDILLPNIPDPPKGSNQEHFFTPSTPPYSPPKSPDYLPPVYEEISTQTELIPKQKDNTFITEDGYQPLLSPDDIFSPIIKKDNNSSESNDSWDV